MQSTITATCWKCGFVFNPTAEQIKAGTWRTSCPVCYPPRRDDNEPEAA